MKFLVGTLAIILTTLLVGCCKDKEKRVEKRSTKVEAGYQEDFETPSFAMAYNQGGEYVIDEETPDLEKFEFVEADEEDDGDSAYWAEAEIDLEASSLEEEDSSELSLAKGEEESFERIQFPLNGNKPFNNQNNTLKVNINKAKKIVSEGKSLSVVGHCCQMGAADFNMALSLQRAETIKKEMVAKGIPGEKITVVAAGQENPLVFTDAEDKQTKIKDLSPNRRAEMYALGNMSNDN